MPENKNHTNSPCFNSDDSRKYCKHMLFTTAQAGVLCGSDEAGFLLCHVANFQPCDFFEEDADQRTTQQH